MDSDEKEAVKKQLKYAPKPKCGEENQNSEDRAQSANFYKS